MEIVRSTFADWFNQQIQAQGWSLRATARKLGVSHTTVINVANGIADPSTDLASKIAELFGLPDQEVFVLAGILRPPGAKTTGVTALIERLEAMPESVRAETLALFNAILEYRRLISVPAADREEARVSLFADLFEALPEDEQDALIEELRERVGQPEDAPSDG